MHGLWHDHEMVTEVFNLEEIIKCYTILKKRNKPSSFDSDPNTFLIISTIILNPNELRFITFTYSDCILYEGTDVPSPEVPHLVLFLN